MSERQTSTPFARSRASKKHSGKPLSPAEMRERSLAHNRAVAQEQAEMRGSKTPISNAFRFCKEAHETRLGLRLKQFKERGQFKGGIAV